MRVFTLIFCLMMISCEEKSSNQTSQADLSSEPAVTAGSEPSIGLGPAITAGSEPAVTPNPPSNNCIDKGYEYCSAICDSSNITPNAASLNRNPRAAKKNYVCFNNCLAKLEKSTTFPFPCSK